MIGSGGLKSRLAKAAGAEPPGQMRNEKLHVAGAKHIFKSTCTKHTLVGPLLEVPMSKNGSWSADVQKLHTSGAKHISMLKCAKHTIFGTLLEDQMPKKCRR